MIVSIMQPYLFPYVGYFQLIAQSDIFVFHDDVQFIKGGWINRNRILSSTGGETWITMPVIAASHDLAIIERFYAPGRRDRFRLLRQLESHYAGAPNIREIVPFVREILEFDETNVADFNIRLLETVSRRLGLEVIFLRSSRLQKTPGLSGQTRVIDLCRRLGASQYVNPIGGSHLYDAAAFAEHGIELRFLETATKPREIGAPYLSIVHDLMVESELTMQTRLGEYKIVQSADIA